MICRGELLAPQGNRGVSWGSPGGGGGSPGKLWAPPGGTLGAAERVHDLCRDSRRRDTPMEFPDALALTA